MTLVKLVCPTGQGREIADTEQWVDHGATVDVDPAVAGHPPSGAEGDLGEGLLAQFDVWAPGDSAGITPPPPPQAETTDTTGAEPQEVNA